MNIWSEMYRKAKQVQNSIAGPPCGACREFMMQLDKDCKY